MATTIVFLVLALAPFAAGVLAALAGILASFGVSAACEATAFDSGESDAAEWCVELSESLDVDAEWIALADAADTVDALESADQAHAYNAHVRAKHDFLDRVRVGIALSRARILKHYRQASAPTPNVQGYSDLTRILGIAREREWCEAMAETPIETPRDYLTECALSSLATLAMGLDDASEHATCTRLSVERYQAELRATFVDPYDGDEEPTIIMRRTA